jgi:diacylglycerol kinase (ATP)
LVAGGDGTVHHALPALVETGVPILHLPMGTENLFAREFRSRGLTTGELVDRLLAGRARAVDVLEVSASGTRVCLVAVMASMGPDAGVIKRMDETRTGPITHLSYVWPIVHELRRPHLAKLRVEVDGRELVTERPGVLVIANSRQYALRADPAHKARVDDGLLDVAFLPAGSALVAGLGVLRSRLRLRGGTISATGLSVRIRGEPARFALQADGEHIPVPPPCDLTITIRPGLLRVIA